MKNPFLSKKGFTLIELVVVIAVLGILAGITLPRLLNSSAGARGTKVIADLRTLDGCINKFELITGAPPTSIAALVPNYLAEVPVAPTGKFIVTSNQGRETEYDNSSAASYVIADGRATLLGATHTVDYYLTGALAPASPIEVASKLNNEILNTQWVIDYFASKGGGASIDSEAVRQDGTPSHAELVRDLLTALGINDEEVSWKIRKNTAGNKIEVFVTKKLTTADVGTQVTITKYNLDGTIAQVLTSKVTTGNLDGIKYPMFTI